MVEHFIGMERFRLKISRRKNENLPLMESTHLMEKKKYRSQEIVVVTT